MVFNAGCGNIECNAVFKYDNRVIERVDNFKYLGVTFGVNAGRHKFDECMQHRLMQAKRVLAIWRRRCKVWMLDPRVACNLFMACVLPVIDYGIALWRPGAYRAVDWQMFERLWRGAARSILGVPVRTPTAAVLGDLGWRPLWTRAANAAIAFWVRITRMPDEALVRKAMRVQRGLLLRGKPCWLRECEKTVRMCPQGEVWWREWYEAEDFRLTCVNVVRELSGSIIKKKWEDVLRSEIQQIADSEWKEEVLGMRAKRLGAGGSKLRTYARFKLSIGFEPYLVRVRNYDKRSLLARLRMGVAPLRIETGRYERRGQNSSPGIPVEMRKCEVCSNGCVEDEYHFVMECNAYNRERMELRKACERCKELSTHLKSGWSVNMEMFHVIMRCPEMAKNVANFVWAAFKKRELVLNI